MGFYSGMNFATASQFLFHYIFSPTAHNGLEELNMDDKFRALNLLGDCCSQRFGHVKERQLINLSGCTDSNHLTDLKKKTSKFKHRTKFT